jgi:hypothetical protein
MESPELALPEQHGHIDPTVETDAGRLRTWLDDLPILDVVETLRLVRDGLDGLNAQRLDVVRRMELLEVYRTTSLRLLHILDPLQLGLLNLSRKRRVEAIDGIGRLLLSLAGGSKRVVADLYAAGGTGQPHPLLGRALFHALQQMSWLLLDSFRYYREVPARQIADMHRLYLAARRRGLLGVTVPEEGVAVTAAGYYHAGMLLALAEPARLEEGEAGRLFDVLLNYADRCRIVPGNSWEGAGAGLYLIDLQSGDLPVSCTQLTSPARPQDACLLDANPAIEAIRARLAGTPARGRMQRPETMVLRRLLPEDRSRERRGLVRRGDGRQVSLLNGLERIHAWLLHAAGKGGPGPVETLDCRVLDRSAGGMKLSWETGSAGDASVGELLGLLEPQDDKPLLRLAIIRSVRVYPEGGMETGVQLLAGGVGAVHCTYPDGPEATALPALFMPAAEAEGVNATLLTAKGVYAFDRPLRIDVGRRVISVRAGRRVYDSPLFDRYEFAAQ